ncbi:MAG: CopD family protein [Longimicrobiales bacterium]|nr:CopD family protein [Longimicrobiales bacterium]
MSAVRTFARGGTPPETALARTGALLGAAALAALLLLGWAQLSAFRDPFVPWQEDAALLLGSSWGTRWVAALALAGATVAALTMPVLRPLGFLLPLPLAAYPALSGHAAGSETWTTAAIVSDWLHVVGAGAWMGSLAVLLAVGRSQDGEAHPLVRHLEPFSRLARWSVAVVVLTGSFATWLHLPTPSALWTEPWGRMLAFKLVLVAGVLAMGAYNWRVLTPEAATPAGARRLVGLARREALAGAAVLVLTGWLAGMAPPP